MFPSILSPRRRIDEALYAVAMEAYIHGVSTSSVDDLVVALGGSGICKTVKGCSRYVGLPSKVEQGSGARGFILMGTTPPTPRLLASYCAQKQRGRRRSGSSPPMGLLKLLPSRRPFSLRLPST